MSDANGDKFSEDGTILIRIKCHHRGRFVWSGDELQYEGGETTVFAEKDPDYICIFSFDKAIKQLGYGGGIEKLWYKLPNESLTNGRKPLWVDPYKNIVEMCEAARKTKEVENEQPNGENVNEGNKGRQPSEVQEQPVCDDMHDDEIENKVSDDEYRVENDEDLPDTGDDEDEDPFVESEAADSDEEPLANSDAADGDGDRDEGSFDFHKEDDDDDDEDEGVYPDTPVSTDEEWTNFENPKKPKYKQPARGFRDIFISLGQEFNSGQEFKDVLLRYALATGFDIHISRTGCGKVAARCSSSSCGWRVYCSLTSETKRWRVKIFQEDHTCLKSGKTKIFKIPQITQLFLERIRKKPKMTAAEIKDELKREFNLIVTKNMCLKAKGKALDIIRGDFKTQFAKLWDYELELNRSNPGSTIELQTRTLSTDGSEMFLRLYICFDALRTAWRQNCRPIIGLDGCFLKWDIQGQILAAVGRDGNNRIFPIAWAVVGIENTDNWEWFVRKLKSDLYLELGDGLTVISDKQKGLLKVMEQELPEAEHRMCARHIYANWRKHHKEGMLKPLFWQVARSYNEPSYEENMKIIKQFNQEAYASLLATNPKTWCRAFFKTTSHCFDVHNNLSESFNNTIKEARTKPILEMLEDIRRQAMERVAKRCVAGERWKGKFTPKAQRDLEMARLEAHHCVVYTSTQGLYEVDDGGIAYTVSLTRRSCACRQWDLTGLPCRHAVCAIIENHLDFDKYISDFYLTSKWQKTYRRSINPMNGEKMWPKSGKPIVYAPCARRKKSGRPSKHDRHKATHESPSKSGKLSRHGRKMRCHHCWQEGHNSATCPKKLEPLLPNPNAIRASSAPNPPQSTQSSQTPQQLGESSQPSTTSSRRTLGVKRREHVPQGYGLYASHKIICFFD